MAKLILLAHGIGDAKKDFYEEWRDVIAEKVDLKNVMVKGLWWEDVLQKVEEKYPIINSQMGELVAQCGFAELKKWTDDKNYKIYSDYIMDVLVYAGLSEMWALIQNECANTLWKTIKDANCSEKETILVGHSLGASMLPHLVWREYAATSSIPYRGMILLASPLGFESPMPNICMDFLQRMGFILGGDRNNVLKYFAGVWKMAGLNRLKFINNLNDIVCSDVKYLIPGTNQYTDLISLRQGFNPNEINILNTIIPNCVETVSFGNPSVTSIGDNHEVLTYLKQNAFTNALNTLLQ